jgi:hypothetical protein
MPVKGSILNSPNRDYIKSKVWWSAYKKDNPDNELINSISYDTVQEVIEASGKAIQEVISTDPEGFKLPERLGYIVVNKYPSNKKIIDPVASKRVGRTVYYRNMHSLGYMFSIRWYTYRDRHYNNVYKFEPCRSLSRKVSASIKNEVPFNQWQYTDFIN